MEEGFAIFLGQVLEHIVLELEGDTAEFFEFCLAFFGELEAAGASVVGVGGADEELLVFHAPDEGGDGIGVATHGAGELGLGEAGGVEFVEVTEDGVLVRGAAGMGDSAAEGLVEAVPGASEEDGQAALGFGWGGVFRGHFRII
ncbi:MAG: hypothetical protein RI897_1612 [Verrucomicrobiota bacterium]|jgi:hypothetical protein